jgi:CDP-glycerol glycerophosphotransferase
VPRPPLRRLARGAIRRVRDLRGPTVSVVVPVYQGEEHLGDALASVLGQRYRHLEVIVVDDGSTDGSRAVAEAFAARDPRVRVLSQPNAGQSAARNRAVEEATGTYLTFVDADDLVTRDGLDVAVRGLERSGSDVAVMPYQRLEGDVVKRAAPWIRALHARPALGVTVSECPDVLVHAIACSKVFRRSFWDAAGLRFPPGVIYEDQILTAQAYRDAAGIDVTSTMAYTWRRQETSTSQGQVTAENATARMDAADESLRLLEPLPAVREERALQLLRHNVPNSTLKLERADDAYLAVLAERVPRLVGAVPADRYAREVPAEHRVVNALLERAAHGDHDAVRRFVAAEGLQPQLFDLVPTPDGPAVDLPGRLDDGLDPHLYLATAPQVALRSSVRGVRTEGEEVAVDVRAWFPCTDPASTTLHARLVGGRAGAAARVTRNGDDATFTSRAGTERRYVGSGWTLRFPRPAGRRCELVLELVLERPDGLHLEGLRSHRVTL